MTPVDVPAAPRHQERDQPGSRHKRVPAKEALARLLVGLILFRGLLVDGFGLLLGGLCRAFGLLVGLRWTVGCFDRTFGRGLLSLRGRLARRSAQSDDVAFGARRAPGTRWRDLVPIRF